MTERDRALAPKQPPLFEAAASPADIAWCAGLFEGEGWAGGVDRLVKDQHGKKRWPYRAVRLVLMTTDLDVLQRFQTTLGVGRVTGPYDRDKPHHKPIWRWESGKRAEVDQAVCAMYPWLGARRQFQIRTAYLKAGRALPWEEGPK